MSRSCLTRENDESLRVFALTASTGRQFLKIGVKNVPGGHFHGAAIVQADIVRREKLTVTADEPPDRHGVFRLWPLDPDPEFQKSKRMQIAEAIAEEAVLVPRILAH